ncbi:PH domain-containing protein [Staphylococcus xylosus]
MILDNVNPNDLYPTEKKGPNVLGTIEYSVQGSSEFEGAFISTSERVILNVDMNGEFYYRSIAYNEIESIDYDGEKINFKFNIGPMPMKDIQKGDVETFVQFVSDKIDH